MPEILNSLAYQNIEQQINYFFDLTYEKYKKRKRGKADEISSQVSQFLDNLSDSIGAQSRFVYTNIPSREIVDFKSVDSRKPGDDFQNIDEAAKYFDNLSNLIYFSVMQHEDPTQRVFFYDMYIQLMNFCYLKGDLLAACAIYTGLMSNNLAQAIDWKQLSSTSRLIFEERETSFTRLFKVSTSYNEQSDLRKKFKTIVPALPLLLGIQTQSKEYYDGFVNAYKEIQNKLEVLDRQNNIMLNRMQLDQYLPWSESYYDYMKKVYLPQSIAEYTDLLKEYTELTTEHGGPIAKQFHDDELAKRLVTFVETTLSENEEMVESPSLPDAQIKEMLEEIDDIRRAYATPELFDSIRWNLMEINSTKVKAEPISDYTSMIFKKINAPDIEESTDENQLRTNTSKDLPQEEQHRLRHKGGKLMLELAQAIESHKPEVTTTVPVGKVSCGFFNKSNMAGYNTDYMEVDELEYDKDGMQIEPILV